MNITPEKINIQLDSTANTSFQIEIGAQQATIDWGDGTMSYLDYPSESYIANHIYTKKSKIFVQITGTAINNLSIPQLGLTSLEFHACTHLQYLNCAMNEIEELKLNECPSLEEIYCNSNNIKNLKISGHPQLTKLILAYNQLQELHLQGCDNLQILDCSHNQLQSIHFDQLPFLHSLNLHSNLLEESALLQIFQQLPHKKNHGIINYTDNPGSSCSSSRLLKKKNWNL